MKWTSILALYFIFWWFSLFLVLPFRLKSSGEPEAHVPGQAESAPPRFSVWRTAKWTTLVSAVLFGFYYLNYIYGWVTVDMLDISTIGQP